MNAIVVRTNDALDYSKITLPVIRQYAEIWGAKLILLTKGEPFLTEDNKPHYRILKIKEFANSYERILLLDADVLITRNCPNPFNEVPKDCIGSIFEDVGSRMMQRHHVINSIQRKFGNIYWASDYTNAGVYIFTPKKHMKLFDPINDEYWLGWGSVDVHMGYNRMLYGFKTHKLSYKWNHMSMFSEAWNGSPSRFDSYIIHYAGGARFSDLNERSKYQIIQDDYKKLYGQK